MSNKRVEEVASLWLLLALFQVQETLSEKSMWLFVWLLNPEYVRLCIQYLYSLEGNTWFGEDIVH